jgi:hypothetical protein
MRAHAATDDGDGRNKRKMDRLLKVSDFLNQFQSHFLPSRTTKGLTDDVVGNITMWDLEHALVFQLLLERLKILEGEKFVADEYGRSEVKSEPLTRQIAKYKNEELEKTQKEIQATPDRTKLVFSILRRCEVWTCKLVAQDQLVTPTRLLAEAARIKTDQCCFSPLINIPSSKYFAKILPPIDVDDRDQAALLSTVTEVTENNTSPSQSTIPAFHRKNKCVQCCTLALPPNKHTWEAYAKLAIMASLIGDCEISGWDIVNDNQVTVTSKNHKELSLIQCLKSPSCVYDLNRNKKGKNPSLNHQYLFSPSSDLVPLWIRAQRNTQALRQLILLFEVNKENDNEMSEASSTAKETNNTVRSAQKTFQDISKTSEISGGKLLMVNQAEIGSEQGGGTVEGDVVRFKASFRGNPMNARARVIEISEHVDHLIEWAVINQSIFTYNRIKKRILTAPLCRQQKIARKRRREDDDCSYRTIISKKIYRDVNEKQNLFTLLQTCRSYVLRWFARRNRNALTIMFSKRIENLSLDIGCSVNTKVLSQAELLRSAGVSSKVQQHMQNSQSGNFYLEDRTLSRIDRRLFIKDRYNGTSVISCQSQVSNLLKTLSRACPQNQEGHKKLVDAAIEDLEHLFETFSPRTIDENNQDDVYRAALNLVNPSKGCTEASLIDILKSTPAPWVEKCSKCKKAGPAGLLTCFNCEQVFHEKCSTSNSGSNCATVNLKDLIHSFPPLHDIFKLKQPKNLEYPDFSMLSENQWMKKTIQIERKTNDDGTVRKLGISFDHTEDCLKALEAIESDACSLVELIKSEESDIRGSTLLAPARITSKGCLIREVHKELCGDRAGLQIGDIIVGVEVAKDADAKDVGLRKFDLSDLSSKDRLALLKVESLKLNLTILRPPINIVEIATIWFAEMKRLNKKILDVFRGMNTLKLWYCGACVRSEASEESHSVFVQAAFCRAVIRRIGMESYARPFMEGNQTSQSGYFSLRRLDSIMTHIMRVESKDKSYDYEPDSFFAPSSDNCTPPRIAWATEALERQPMELLCLAMKKFANSSFRGSSHLNTQRSALIRHFLLAFGSWCVGGTVTSNSYSQLIGPPDIFMYSRTPWLRATCSVCYSQPATSKKICNNRLCLSNAFRGEQQVGAIDREEVEKTGKIMKEYSIHASLVGKSFLVLPHDPLVEYVSRIVNIEHENRPVEFVVASYLPSDYHDAVVNGRQKDQYDKFDEKDGIYHLLPVVSSRQQNFLLERCKMRNQNEENKCLSSWPSLDILNLDGVARYSPAALRNKMKESSEISLAIDDAIVQQVCTSSSDPPNSFKQLSSLHKIAMTEFSSSSADFALEMQDKLLETILKGTGGVEAIRGLLSTNINHDQNDNVGKDEDRSKWKISQHREHSDFLEFGLSRLHTGLLPINPVRASWKILKLENISDEKYSLYYSDFLFQDEAGKKDLKKKLHPQSILPLQGSPSAIKGSMKTFVLSREEPCCGDMFGWGFEILKWKGEGILLRVGRVLRESPAHRAGLKTQDIIKSVNGMRFTQFRDISSFISSILGASNIKIRIPENLDRNDKISMLLSTIKGTKIRPSLVTLCVFRPLFIDSRVIRSGMSVSRSETSMQHSCEDNDRSPRYIDLNGGDCHSRPSSLHTQTASHNKATHAQAPHTQPTHIQVIGARSKYIQAPHTQPTHAEAIHTRAPQIQPTHTQVTHAKVMHTRAPHTQPIHIKRNWSSIYRILEMTYTSRPQVQLWNFYCPANSGTILTTLEVAVLLQSWKNQTRKLGVRLLMPRYDIKTIADQMKIIFSWTSETFVQIPVVQGTLYQKILHLDYNRMNCSHHPEIGPFVLLEEKNGIKYKYRLPRRPLPIDRSLEIQFDADQQKLRENPIQQPLQFSASDRHNQVGNNAHQDPGQTSFRRTFMDNYESYSSNLETRKSGDQDRGSTSSIHAPFQNRRSTPPPHDSEIITNRLVVDLVDEDDEMPNANQSDLSTDEPSMSIYTNNINRQGDNANPGFTNVVNPGSSLTGQYPERIRGGGSSDAAEPNDSTVDHQGNYLYLCDLPRNQWKGKAVYTFVQTASKGSICRDALLVGFARMCIEDDSRDEEIPDKVEIEAHYLSGTGYLKNTKIHRSDSDEVWIVNIDQDCEEARVIAKLHSQNKLPRDYQEELQRVTLQKTIPDNYQIEDKQNRQNKNLTDKQRENDHSTRSQTGTSDGQQVRGEESSTIARSCADALCLEFDRTPYLYVCEEQPFCMKSSVEYRSGCHECSLCSLPFERYLVCTVPSEHKENHSKYRFSRSLGCSLMSDTALAEQPSYSDGNIPGWLGEGKSLLLKIARLIPSSLKNATDDFREEADPLRSFRIFDNEANYATWLSFVAECTCTEMLAQALVALLASIQRTKLPDWWSRRNSGWSTPYAIMRESNLSALYLHIYVLDAALSGIISRPLEEKTNPHNKSNGANDVQNRRMKQYWERAMAQGYKAFEGNNHDKCYHCSDGGHLLCCELCPNVQHHECCDPKLNNDVKLDHWICDSCINDLDTYEVEEEFEDFQDEELSS